MSTGSAVASNSSCRGPQFEYSRWLAKRIYVVLDFRGKALGP